MIENREISDLDRAYLKIIRKSVASFLRHCAKKYDFNGRLLDIAPQDHAGASPFFRKATIETLDINPNSGATYILDLCKCNRHVITGGRFDLIVCTEVLEHTLNPFSAVKEINRLLKQGGLALISTPFNFRIHGPLPDCWRFTEHGLRALFAKFKIIELNEVKEKDRWLMPVHYTGVFQKGTENV
ncbi:MAG: methyltransferase domain-containing protein [Chitinivibrionales bacterium]|nr:methyltransferase domain-containing protein [Chitinivibrionales bacterium]